MDYRGLFIRIKTVYPRFNGGGGENQHINIPVKLGKIYGRLWHDGYSNIEITLS